MTSGVDLIYNILNVDASNYTNYGKKPNIKRENIDNLFFMKPGEIGIKISNIRRETGQDYAGLVIVRKYYVALRITEVDKTKRDNLLKDVENLFKDKGVIIEAMDYDETFPNISSCLLELSKIGD